METSTQILNLLGGFSLLHDKLELSELIRTENSVNFRIKHRLSKVSYIEIAKTEFDLYTIEIGRKSIGGHYEFVYSESDVFGENLVFLIELYSGILIIE